MAIKDFTDALKTLAYKSWFSQLDPNVIKQGSAALREKFEKNATKNNFLITDDKIRDMAAYVTDGRNISDQEVEEIKGRMFESLRNAKNNGVQYNIVKYSEKDDKRNEIVVENINFQTIETILNAGFGKKLEGWKRSVGSGFHRGHVYGLPTVLLNETIAKLERLEIKDQEVGGIIGRGQKLKNYLVSILKSYQQELKNQDLQSSNMGNSGVNYDIYAEYSKGPDQFLIEMQVRRINTTSGTLAGKTLAELKQFFNPGKMNEGLIDNVLTSISKPSVISNFLTIPGSLPWINIFANKIANTIDINNKSRNDKKASIPLVKVAAKKIDIIRDKKDKQRVKDEIAKVNKIIRELEATERKTKTIALEKTNLTSLQNLLNANLVDQVKRNMGNGTRSDVLNLQTGRFAESVEVTRLSESRQGMITAFYTYMKNPYATFSAGGRQEFPTSRDPKTLISRSIREIAAEQVSNRLRSVLV